MLAFRAQSGPNTMSKKTPAGALDATTASHPHRAGGGLWLPKEPPASDNQTLAGDEPPLAVDMLLQCHQRVAGQCETLQRLCAYLQDHGVDEQAKGAAGAVLRYFDLAAPHHHADEEQDWLGVLQPLWAEQPERLALLDRLRAEHRVLEALWRSLKEVLQALVAAADAQTFTLAPEQVTAFVQAYQAHIAFEEGQWLVLARQAVSDDVLAQLGRSMVARRQQAYS